MEKKQQNRIHLLDEIRGIAIFCMIFHHAFLDIGYLLGLQWGYDAFDFFTAVQPAFWVVFIITSGICTNLSRNSTKRGFILLGFSLAFTFVTAIIMPRIGFEGEEIYFGILHCLACCMILAGISKKITIKVPPSAGLMVCLVLFLFTYRIQSGWLGIGALRFQLPAAWHQVEYLFPLGIVSNTFHSADYFPLIPWIFVFFFGVFVGRYWKKKSFPSCMYRSRSRFFQFMGRNSLWVYVLHQPILYVVFLIIKAILF